MKIIHIVWGLRYGGAETMLVDIINRQCLKHNVELLIENLDIDNDLLSLIDSRAKIITINRPRGSRNPYYVLKTNFILLFSGADIIHVHQENMIRYLLVRFLKKNLCLTVHCVRMDVAEVKLFKHIFAISTKVKEEILRKTGKEAVLVPNGIDVQGFNRKKENHPGFRMVQIGRLDHKHKGQDLTLKAIHNLVTQYNYTAMHLDVIGVGDSEKYLKELADDLNITTYVTFLGSCTKDYIKENLTNYDLLLQPSLWEGFGLTIIEAMSAMTPTLISNVDGMKMISKDGELSYTFQSGNTDDLTQKIMSIIQLSENERQILANKAYEHVAANYDISSTANNYLKNYEIILTKAKKEIA